LTVKSENPLLSSLAFGFGNYPPKPKGEQGACPCEFLNENNQGAGCALIEKSVKREK